MRLPRHLQLGLFFVLLALFGGLLMVVVPVLRWESGYNTWFRSFGDVVFVRFWFWGDGSVRFLDLKAPEHEVIAGVQRELPRPLPAGFDPPNPTNAMDTLMVVKNRRLPGQIGLLRTSARNLGYKVTATFLVFFLATRMPWRRWLWRLAAGLVLVHLFVAVRLTFTLCLWGFGAVGKGYALFSFSDGTRGTLEAWENVLVHDPFLSYPVGVFLWLVVALPTVKKLLFAEESDAST